MLATGDAGPSVAFSAEQASGGTVGTYRGRKFVPREKAAAAAKLKIPKNVNLEGLHQAMEEDSAAVDALKREVDVEPDADRHEVCLLINTRIIVSMKGSLPIDVVA